MPSPLRKPCFPLYQPDPLVVLLIDHQHLLSTSTCICEAICGRIYTPHLVIDRTKTLGVIVCLIPRAAKPMRIFPKNTRPLSMKI